MAKAGKLETKDFPGLFKALSSRGYRIAGPTIQDNAVIYDYINAVDDLPVGWTDEQDNGRYRLKKSGRQNFFDYVVGPHSWKKFLFPPSRQLLEIKKDKKKIEISEPDLKPPRHAFIGVRACDLSAIAVQDKIFSEGPYADPYYTEARKNLFIIAVNCTSPGGTCFCASLSTGPKATDGYDLALTEINSSDNHYFLIEAGTKSGEEVLKEIKISAAGNEEIQAAAEALEKATANMGRSIKTEGLKDILHDNFDSLHWEEIASRCLTCGNCTMVCPTCFCSNVEDVTDLTGQQAERWRRWDSCYSVDFSYIHGGSIRVSEMSRYRQWMTHKLAYWQGQFGTLGCVGCGRCITWCPAGIDITEEARYFREKA